MQKHTRQSSGISRQLLVVFVRQLLFISIVTVLGIYVAEKVIEGVMVRAALQGEAEHFWALYRDNRDQPLPDTDNLRGYLAENGDSRSLPAALRDLSPGYGRVQIHDRLPMVYVEQKGADRLYLVFDEQSVSRLSFYFGIVPLSLALITIYVSAWFAYRQSRRAVSPLVKLAKTMRAFDIDTQSMEQLKLDQLENRTGNEEVNTLLDALCGFIREIDLLLERERRFTRDASHELRTPLTVIQGSAEWLADNADLSARQAASLARILRTTADMNETVNALLLLARGVKKGLRTEIIDATDAMQRLLAELAATHNADQHVSVAVQADSPMQLECSPQGFNVVMSNLLRNAFHHTREGEVSIHIREHQISISNKGREGQALSDGQLKRMFQPFERGSDGGRGGDGIGLDIVRRLCDHFGWRINAHYTAQTGTTFVVTFA